MKFLRRFFAAAAVGLALAGCGGGGSGGATFPAFFSGNPGTDGIAGPPGTQDGQGIGGDPGSSSEATGFDVILLAGEANMVGFNSDLDPALDAPDPRIFQLGFAGPHKNEVIPATDPLEHPDGNHGVGLAMQFSKAYLDSLPPGRRVLLVPAGVGATGFSAGRWSPGGDAFEQAVARANAAMEKEPNSRFVSVLWHQGETDVATWGATPATYQVALDKAIYSFRARIGGAASAPMVLGKFTDGWGLVDSDAQNSRAAKAAIMAAIDDTPVRVPFTAVAQSAGLAYGPDDAIHFNAAGQREQGLRYFAQLTNARSHALAGFTLPSAPGALVASSGATWIKLGWTAPPVSGSNTINGYRVAYRLAGETAWTDRYVDGAETSAYLVGLKPEATYAVRIAAVGQAGLGAASQLDSVVTASFGAIAVPQAPFEYTFEEASLVNTGSLGAPMNGTAAGAGVTFVSDAARGKVLRLSQEAGAKGWVTVPRAINGTAYTKSVWVKFTSYSGNQNLISSDNGEFAGKNLAFFSDFAAILRGEPAHFMADNTAKAVPGQHAFSMRLDRPVSAGGHGRALDMLADPGGIPALDTWYNFVVTYDGAASGGTLRLYRNGVKVAETKGVPALSSQTSDFTIGAFANADALNGGFLDNVRVYDAALDEGAISDIYAKEVVP